MKIMYCSNCGDSFEIPDKSACYNNCSICETGLSFIILSEDEYDRILDGEIIEPNSSRWNDGKSIAKVVKNLRRKNEKYFKRND